MMLTFSGNCLNITLSHLGAVTIRLNMIIGRALRPLMVSSMLILALHPQIVLADGINPGAYTIDSVIEGETYGDVTIAFWQWVLSTPATNHPLLDETGENCRANQRDYPVFFLIFSGGGMAERTCDVPAGMPILVPVNVVVCSLAEYPGATIEELHTCAEEDESSNPGLFLAVDGTEFVELESYRVHSEAFEATLPDDPILDVAGSTTAVSDGYWVILEPLSPGQHEVHFKASLSNPTTGILFYSDDVKYHLNIVEEDSGPMLLAGSSTSGEFNVEMEWTSNDIGNENIFVVKIMNSEGSILTNATYDIMVYRGDQHLDETHRSGQTASEQKYVFTEAGSYELRIENINGSGESDHVTLPIQYTPEFPLGLFVLLGSALGLILALGRFRFFLGNILSAR